MSVSTRYVLATAFFCLLFFGCFYMAGTEKAFSSNQYLWFALMVAFIALAVCTHVLAHLEEKSEREKRTANSCSR